jgi:hypothetical protein
MKQLYIILLSLVSIHVVLAQKPPKKIHMYGVWGEAVQSATETLLQCKNRAINEAKIAAMRKAGVSENITSYSTFFQSEVKSEYEDVFKTDILNDINGYVIVNEELEVNKKIDDFNNLIVKVKIDATVLKYEFTRDLTFDAWVTGLDQAGYLSTDAIEFSIKPSQDMYIRIFDLVDQKVYPIYPNILEKNKVFNKGELVFFPTTDELQYIFEFEGERESHNFIVLLLKEDIVYTSNSLKSKNLLNWIFSIPPDQRVVKTYSFDVFKEK